MQDRSRLAWALSARAHTYGLNDQFNFVAQGNVSFVAAEEKLDTPQLLPDGEWLLFTLGRRGLVSWDEAQAVVQSMRTGERRVVLKRATNAWYLRSGHLLFGRGGGIFAVPFDVKTLTVRGEPVGVVEGVRRASLGTSGAVHFAVSDSGTLAYLSGSPQRAEIQVVWNWLPELDARVPVK